MNVSRALIFLATALVALTLVPLASAAAPKLTKVVISPPSSEEPGMMPSLTQPSAHLTYESAGCRIMSFRYANEDGIWSDNIRQTTRSHFMPSAGYGIKGVYIQLIGACVEGGPHVPIGNVVFTKYMITKLKPVAPPAATVPTITKVAVSLPVSDEPGMMPSMVKPGVMLTATVPANCVASEFRYANEDGNWKSGWVNRERPYITPTAGLGHKGVYVQLTGTCNGGKTFGPVGNVVYAKYTLKKITNDPPAKATPRITKVTVSPPSSEEPGMMPSMTKPNVFITASTTGCDVTEFRYANEDGNWKSGDHRQINHRSFITPTPGYGIKGVYVQLLGSCDDGKTYGPVSNIVFAKYTIKKLAA